MSELKAILATPHPKMKNACDGAIEVYPKSEADKVIAELKEAQRWRKFSEERPKDKQRILVFVENPSKYGTYIELRRWDMGCKFDVEDQELYTKWMPLPKAPEVK